MRDRKKEIGEIYLSIYLLERRHMDGRVGGDITAYVLPLEKHLSAKTEK